jgi:DNA invertase Pin-like site-specific DNA recombinase
MSKRVALYVRVSTTDQTIDNQLLDLRRYASDRGWRIADEYSDTGISGTKSTRPGLDRLMDSARKRKFDVLLVWRFDRFARSVKHLVLALEELRSLNIDFVSYQENVDTSSALGQAIFTIIAAMAALERNIIVERVHAGLRRARKEGKRIGRPTTTVDTAQVMSLRRQGHSIRQIAARIGASRAKILRVLQAAVPKPSRKPTL